MSEWSHYFPLSVYAAQQFRKNQHVYKRKKNYLNASRYDKEKWIHKASREITFSQYFFYISAQFMFCNI